MGVSTNDVSPTETLSVKNVTPNAKFVEALKASGVNISAGTVVRDRPVNGLVSSGMEGPVGIGHKPGLDVLHRLEMALKEVGSMLPHDGETLPVSQNLPVSQVSQTDSTAPFRMDVRQTEILRNALQYIDLDELREKLAFHFPQVAVDTPKESDFLSGFDQGLLPDSLSNDETTTLSYTLNTQNDIHPVGSEAAYLQNLLQNWDVNFDLERQAGGQNSQVITTPTILRGSAIESNLAAQIATYLALRDQSSFSLNPQGSLVESAASGVNDLVLANTLNRQMPGIADEMSNPQVLSEQKKHASESSNEGLLAKISAKSNVAADIAIRTKESSMSADSAQPTQVKYLEAEQILAHSRAQSSRESYDELGTVVRQIRDAVASARSLDEIQNGNTAQASRSISQLQSKIAELSSLIETKSVAEQIDRAVSSTSKGEATALRPSVSTPVLSSGESARDVRGAVQEQVMQAMTRHAIAQGRVTIQLSPHELGVIDIEFRTERGEVQVAIAAREGSTKELLDLMLPRLRQNLEDAGVNLGKLELSQDESNTGGSSSTAEERALQLARDTSETGTNEGHFPAESPSTAKLGRFDVYV